MAFLIENGRTCLKSFLGGSCIIFVPWISYLGTRWQYIYTDFGIYLLLLYAIVYNGALVLLSYRATVGAEGKFFKVRAANI